MKLKTHSASKKRFKITGKGKLMYEKSSKQHLLMNKSKRQKRVDPSGKHVFAGDAKNIAKLLPYS